MLSEKEKKQAEDKFERLKSYLKSFDSVLVAFSGGVDSAFLMKVSTDVLGTKATALTAKSPSLPLSELKGATKLASDCNSNHIIVESNELANPNYSTNPENRCYYCKSELYSICEDKAKELGINQVIDGFNADDSGDYRPGRVAAGEKGVLSPLADIGLTKAEIRYLSQKLDLPTWDKPNMACLSSRFPYGTEITEEKLKQVELAEDYMKGLGFRQLRVRYYNEIAKIEIDKNEIEKYVSPVKEKVEEKFKELGFTNAILDSKGYRTGSLNEILSKKNLTEIGLKTN